MAADANASAKTSDNRATIAHLSAFITFIGIPSPVGPLIAWLIWKDDPVVEAHAKEALNFNISWFLYAIVGFFLIFVLIGFVLLPVIAIAWFVLVIIGAVRAADGELRAYPLTIRFVS